MQLSQGRYGGYLVVHSNDTKQLRAGRREEHHIKLKLHKCNYPTWNVAKVLMLTPLLFKKKKEATVTIKIRKR